MPATVVDLVAIRRRVILEKCSTTSTTSQHAPQRFRATTPRTSVHSKRGLSAFGEIHETVRVATDRREFDVWRAEEGERLRRAGIPVEHAAYSHRFERGQRDDDREKRETSVRTVVWNELTAESPEFRRSIILGEQASAKSCLLRHAAGRLARKSAKQLRSRSVPLDDILIPIRVRLSEFRNRPIANAISNLVCGPVDTAPEDAQQTAQFRELLQRKLRRPQDFVVDGPGVVDALLLDNGGDAGYRIAATISCRLRKTGQRFGPF